MLSIAAILRSGVFSLIVILLGTYFGGPLLSKVNAKSIDTSDLYQTQFMVAAESISLENGVGNVSLIELQSLKERLNDKQKPSFLMTAPKAEIKNADGTSSSYHVIHSTNDAQYIESIQRDTDMTIWCRYLATKDSVIPLWTRNYSPGHMLTALSYSVLIAISLNLLGRLIFMLIAKKVSKTN